jgi:hypothetical protein
LGVVMGLMRRDTLQSLKRNMHKMDFRPQDQQFHALVDHGLAALDALEGGRDTIERKSELKERERQVSLALADLKAELENVGTMPTEERPDVEKALYMLDLVDQMLRAKGTRWHREWAWYQPRIEEEFGNGPGATGDDRQPGDLRGDGVRAEQVDL